MADSVSFREIKMEGGWLMVKPVQEDRGIAMKIVRGHKDKLYNLEVKEHRNKRSTQANKYAWELINNIAEVERRPTTDIYKLACRDVPNTSATYYVAEEEYPRFKMTWEDNGISWVAQKVGKAPVPGMLEVEAFYGGSTFDSRQFSILIEKLHQDCWALGIDTKTPEEVASMLEAVK